MPFLDPDRSETIGFQQEVARLEALLEASRQIHGALQLDDVLHCALKITVKELEADGAFFSSNGAIETARQTFYGDVPNGWLEINGKDCEACASVPLLDKRGRLLTTLVVLRHEKPLSLEEHDFLEGLALQSAVAVENARQHERLLAWERAQQDLAAARAVQTSLLPHNIPEIAGYGLDFRCRTCYEVGGDYLDIFLLPDGRYMMTVADVAGKGFASALVSGSFRAAFRAMAAAGLPLDELAGRMNDLHHNDGPEARRKYVTAIVMRLDAERHELEMVNAGHNPGFLTDEHGQYHLIKASGPPLGMFPKTEYAVEHHSISQGGKLMLYTDGLTEVSRGDDEFGTERLLSTFLQSTESRCGVFLDCLWEELSEFADGGKQQDDMTALALIRYRAEGAAA